ncbi:unnamed protein product [Adineta ricciae]|uniref:Kinesin motor domain-containing protein n=1 Tax=Adineta ricciae TaxID=249248 RepID=A0A815W1U4_ADIRI|nr:unnamed protein product [Adineta ricciae]CAF1542292.1 unnamed protein product [Adineta ricciae]
MRLVQFQNDIPPTSLTKDDLTISTIHLVDLAGSERVNRAKTVGERVKEAGNINSSLMVLRRCFENLRENQSQGASKISLIFYHIWSQCVRRTCCRRFHIMNRR